MGAKLKSALSYCDKWFYALVWILAVLALVYFAVSMTSIAGAYRIDVVIVSIGVMSILHLIAFPIGYFGYSLPIKVLLLIFVVICSIWCCLFIIYIIVFAMLIDSNFRFHPLHHVILFFYCYVNLILLILASIKLISILTKLDKEEKNL